MNCKNCNKELLSSYNYCSNCGGKVINKRFNFSFLISEFTSEVLTWDNKLLKTFWHLLKYPDVVILDYINGVRKKYMSPFRFLLIALTLSGLSIYLVRDQAINGVANFTANGQQVEGMKNFMNILYDYNSIFTSLLIPFYAFISWLVFANKKKLNYFEHIVLYTYSQAIFSIIGVISTVAMLFVPSESLTYFSFILIFLWICYNMYILKKIFQLTISQSIVKLLFFAVVFLFIFIISIIGFFALMFFIEGPEFFEQFKPK